MDLKELGIFELLGILVSETMYLEGCTLEEARNGVLYDIKKHLIKEIEWVAELNGK